MRRFFPIAAISAATIALTCVIATPADAAPTHGAMIASVAATSTVSPTACKSDDTVFELFGTGHEWCYKGSGILHGSWGQIDSWCTGNFGGQIWNIDHWEPWIAAHKCKSAYYLNVQMIYLGPKSGAAAVR